MPVDSIRSIGVASVAAGSSTITRGTIRRWPKLSLMPWRGSVMPAKALNSAADSVVGTAIMRIASAGGLIASEGGAAPSFGRPAR